MKKILVCIMILMMTFTLTACKEEKKQEELKWPEETYFDSLPAPSKNIDKITKDEKNDTQAEYSV